MQSPNLINVFFYFKKHAFQLCSTRNFFKLNKSILGKKLLPFFNLLKWISK